MTRYTFIGHFNFKISTKMTYATLSSSHLIEISPQNDWLPFLSVITYSTIIAKILLQYAEVAIRLKLTP